MNAKMPKAVVVFAAITTVFLSYAGDISFQLHVLQESIPFACGIYDIGDIDGDGYNDFVAGGANPDLGWYRYPDLTTRHTVADSAGQGFGYELFLVDVDNDGDLDVMTSQAGITWYENPLPDGGPTTDSWTVHAFGSDAKGSHDFKAGDINNDGKIDGVERGQNTTSYTVYLQVSPTDWTTFTVPASRSGVGTALGDIGSDGDLDILNADYADGSQSEFWENTLAPSTALLPTPAPLRQTMAPRKKTGAFNFQGRLFPRSGMRGDLRLTDTQRRLHARRHTICVVPPSD